MLTPSQMSIKPAPLLATAGQEWYKIMKDLPDYLVTQPSTVFMETVEQFVERQHAFYEAVQNTEDLDLPSKGAANFGKVPHADPCESLLMRVNEEPAGRIEAIACAAHSRSSTDADSVEESTHPMTSGG